MNRVLAVALSLLAGWLALSAPALGAERTSDAPAAATAPGAAHYQRVCAACHDGAVQKAPHRSMIALMTPEAILHALEHGIMRQEAAPLNAVQRVEVAEYLAGAALGTETVADIPACTASAGGLDMTRPPAAGNWGMGHANTRHVPAAVAGVTAADVADLTTDWAVRFPGANRARSQPTFAGGALLVGSHGGRIYALDERSGCALWSYQAAAEVRTGIVVEPWRTGDAQARPRAFFGDVLGNVYAVDARTGEGLWRQRPDDHPNATITGTPSYHDGRLYVPVSSLEVSLAANPAYPCCTFRGSVAAYDAASGERLWKTYTIDQPAVVQSQNRAGTDMYGPSGAVIWNSPAIDPARRQLYVATGENMSSPATLTSDAMFAMDLDDGRVRWVFQATANDVWNTACDTENDHSCPPEGGPDFDFGAATMLVRTSDGRELVLGGQKSGVVHAVDPDSGKLIWQTRVGRGGIQGGIHFGMAAAGDRLFVPISDMPDGRSYEHAPRPGLHALDLRSGEPLWYAPAPDVCNGREFCHPGISQAITAASDLVLAGGMDGVLRIHDAATGRVLRALDTTTAFPTTDGGEATGGSFGGGAGPVVQNGRIVLSSGYGIYNHMPGNLLLVLRVPEPATP